MARPEQLPFTDNPNAKVSIYQAGRGSGKTCSATNWMLPDCLQNPGTQAAVLAPTYGASTGVCMFSSESGIVTTLNNVDESLGNWNAVKNTFTLLNGSQIRCFSSKHRKDIRGPEFHIAWIDEMADLDHDMECWHVLMPAVRLKRADGQPSRIYCTGTPRPTELVLDLADKYDADPENGAYEFHQGSMMDNIANLDETTVKETYAQWEGTRYFLQEIEGKLLRQAANALWTQDTISTCRVLPKKIQFEKIAIGVDPAVSSDKRADHTGIIVVGVNEGIAYVLADYSRRSSPLEWSRDLVRIARDHHATSIVYEKNLAGPLIRDVMKGALNEMDAAIRLIPVQARGKKEARAEPIAALYEAGKVKHMPNKDMPNCNLDKLESQMVTWEPTDNKSPDRIDALVHVIDHLLLRSNKVTIFRAGDMPWAKK